MRNSSIRHLRRPTCPKQIGHVLRSRRGGIPGQRSACRRTWGSSMPPGPSPGSSTMGEDDSVHKRRAFRWPKDARDLIRAYKQRTSRSQQHTELDRRTLVTKLVEISGNPRDACLRFLHEFGVNEKRAYREWTKPEQQRLLDLIATMPVEEAAKQLRRPAGSVRSMLHRHRRPNRAGMVHQVFTLAGPAHAARRNTKMD